MYQNRKVKNGTPIHSEPSLCRTCRNAMIVKGQGEQEYIMCDELRTQDSLVTIHVTQCSKYDNKSTVALRDMNKIAWVIATDKSGNTIGFMSPKNYEKAKKKGAVEDDNRLPLANPLTGEEVY